MFADVDLGITWGSMESEAKSTIILRTRQGFAGKVFSIIFSTSTEYEFHTAFLGNEKAQQQELNS